jgi:RND superfamily putative drug exporter
MFKLLGDFVARHWLAVILLWVGAIVGIRLGTHWLIAGVKPDNLAAVGHALLAGHSDWDAITNDGDLAYMPDRMTSVRGEQLAARAFPDDKSKSQLVVVVARQDAVLTAQDMHLLTQIGERLMAPTDPPLPTVDLWTPSTEVIGNKLVSPDRKAALAVVSLSTEFMAIQNIDILKVVERVLDEFRHAPNFPAGLELGISGSAAVGGDMLASAAEGVENTEVITLLLVVGILGIVYRSPVLVLIPVVTLGISFMVACDLVACLTQIGLMPNMEWFNFKVFKTSKIFIVTILFGSGTDFCLFLIARYREELAHRKHRREALAAALTNVGDAITASAATTICGLGMMFFAAFGKYHNSGPTIGLCLLVGLLACLTLAPALLRMFSRVVFWPMGIGHGGAAPVPSDADEEPVAPVVTSKGVPASARFWSFVSQQIVQRPGLILAASVLLMTPLAYIGWYTPVTYNLLAELDPSRPSVQGTNLLTRHFQPGETGPVIILAHKPNAGFNTEAGEQDIARLTKILYDMPGVESVRSIAEPLGDVPGLSNPFSRGGRMKMAAKRHPKTKATYQTQVPKLAGDVTRLDVVLKVDPFSSEALDYLDRIDEKLAELQTDEASPWHNVEFDFIGTTAATRDLKAVTQSDQQLIQQLVVIMVLGILIILLRQPLVCFYLILSVLFSYLVTLGLTELAFKSYFPDFHGLDWKVPIFLFVILVAVGEDYNIYLVTRVVEEQKHHGRMKGLRVAVERTGGIITSCGVIMAGTFISMMAGTLRGMLELGFALTLGVMLDTIVVRPILVPAFLALIYRIQDRREQVALPPEPGPVPAEALPHARPARQTPVTSR